MSEKKIQTSPPLARGTSNGTSYPPKYIQIPEHAETNRKEKSKRGINFLD